jgi:glycosyltransferase involved in cell wall biosynthesis
MTTALRRLTLGAYVPARTAGWPALSRLFVMGDDFGWSIDDDRARLTATAQRLGYDVAPTSWARFARRQAVFHHDHFAALQRHWVESSHRLGLSYFHGRPGTAGYPEFDRAFEALRKHASRIERVQVTHAEMHDLVVGAGVAPDRIFSIPIGVDVARFSVADAASRADARELFGVPSSAFTVGSFLKDGVGLGEGLEPKLVKGPDTLVAVLEQLRASIPELFVLLTGPARGYVRTELERLGIPHRHKMLESRYELAPAYQAVDVTLVTSRQEGGPKALLESMAAGTPLVTTRVGQATELVRNGENGLVAAVDDVEELADAVVRIHADPELANRLRTGGRPTAEAHAEERLDSRWAELLQGFVGRGGARVD